MGSVKIPYYVIKRGQGFFQPTKKMRALGFQSVPCGPDGPEAWAKAEEWNRRWQAVRKGQERAPVELRADNLTPARSELLTIYPRDAFGDVFNRLRKTEEWKTRKPRTHEDYWRAWRHIKPVFGDVAPRTVGFEHIDRFYAHVKAKHGLSEAHRTIKIWRVLWRVSAAMKLCDAEQDPSFMIRNTAPQPRKAVWQEGEVVRLVKGAWRLGYRGLAAVIAVGYDTALSPVDARSLTAGQRVRTVHGSTFHLERAKSGRSAIGVLSRRSERVLEAYLEHLGVEMVGEAPLFRNRSGAPYSKDTLGDDFRVVRVAVFGDAERGKAGRKLMDMRRTAAVEAFAGGAQAGQVSAMLANTLSATNSLHKAYSPVDIRQVDAAAKARRQGRRRLRENEP